MIFIETNSSNPFYNFAVELYLMKEKELPTSDEYFLFWRTEPTVMLGRFQNPLEELNLPYIEENGIHLVRRLTGGGTIYTDLGGWQFSFIVKGNPDEIDFNHYMSQIIFALEDFGLAPTFNSRNDIAIENRKISGNAQCMKNGYTLHHGSLLFDTNLEEMWECLKVSQYKIKSKGIKSIRERTGNIADYLTEPISSEDFKEKIVAKVIGNNNNQYQLTEEDNRRVEAIAEELFHNWEWTMGASPAYTLEKEGIYPGGKVKIQLNVVKGIIQDVQFSGDFFSQNGVEKLRDCLLQQRFERETIEKALVGEKEHPSIYRISYDNLIECLFQ